MVAREMQEGETGDESERDRGMRDMEARSTQRTGSRARRDGANQRERRNER